MKKSLSVILSAAMGFSMFASVAFGATQSTADFSDLKDLTPDQKAKFDALISDGTFEGTATGTFGLKEKMNRAQYAKVAAKIFGLTVDANAVPTQFADVKKDDPANGYAVPFIAALSAKGLTDGYAEGKYAPALEVTKEQLATFLIRGLGKEADAKTITPVVDSTVSPWATGYVALAIKLGLLSNEASGKFNGTTPATRDLLVLSASAAKAQYVPPVGAKVSVSEAKATGAKTMTVKLSQPVDTAKATLSVARGGAAVTGVTTWSADKTTATIALDTKLVDATYTVTLAGLDNIDKKSADVVAQKEQIKKIDILTASDILPQSDGVQVEFKATNQYGEQSDLAASSFNIQTGNVGYRNVSGKQAIKVDLKGLSKDTTFPVTIIHTDSGVSASKVFKVGDLPIVSKIEVGDVILPSGVKNFESGSKKAYLKFTAYDQYGTKITTIEDKLNGQVVAGLKSNRGVTIVPSDTSVFNFNTDAPFVDYDGDGTPEIELVSNTPTSDKEATITLFANGTGQSVSKTVKVVTPKIPATVEFGNFTDTVAVGDKEVFLPIVVKDNQGNELSGEDIYKNKDKFAVYSTNSVIGKVEIADDTYGANQGKIRMSNITGKGNASIFVGINAASKNSTLSVAVQEERKPGTVKITSEPAGKIINNAETTFKVKFYDQYNTEIKNSKGEFLKNGVVDTATTNNYKARVTLEQKANASGLAKFYTTDINKPLIDFTDSVNASTYGEDGNKIIREMPLSEIYDTDLKLNASAAKLGNFSVKVEVLELKNNKWEIASNVNRNFEVITGKEDNQTLSFSVALDKGVNNTIFAATKHYKDNVSAATYGSTYAIATTKTKLAKEIKVSATDSSNTKVELPAGSISSVTSTNPSVVNAEVKDGKFYATGGNAGTATITVGFNTPNGYKTASLDITSKAEVPAVDSIVADKTTADNALSVSELNGGTYATSANLMKKLTVKDQYGDEFVNEKTTADNTGDVATYDEILGIRYYVTDIKGTGAVKINAVSGKISEATDGLTSFRIMAVAPNGKSASIFVAVKK